MYVVLNTKQLFLLADFDDFLLIVLIAICFKYLFILGMFKSQCNCKLEINHGATVSLIFYFELFEFC